MRDIPTSYFISDNTTENMDARSHMAHLDVMGRASTLQSEVSTSVEEQKELCYMQVTAADIELQRMWCNFMLAEQKYEHEDSDKQRLHEERMARIHQQVEKRAVSRKRRGLNPVQIETFNSCVKYFVKFCSFVY